MNQARNGNRDQDFLDRAIALSREAAGNGGGPFGAVVVKDGAVVGSGANRVASTNDPTAHAEIVAIREACRQLSRFDLAGATLYSSCEPCPMCLGAILWARLDRLVYANTQADAAAIGFDDAAFWQNVKLWPRPNGLRCEHRPSAAARAVFAEWHVNPSRIRY
ncbi:MAG: nucleoside deaminase [Proteobacteria bacterium]|nr:nucleoside deaminase [Pseudomonadota bacterium]